MSLSILNTRAQSGITALPVNVEVHLAGGLPSMTIVGLADTEVKESRERVAAFVHHHDAVGESERLTLIVRDPTCSTACTARRRPGSS